MATSCSIVIGTAPVTATIMLTLAGRVAESAAASSSATWGLLSGTGRNNTRCASPTVMSAAGRSSESSAMYSTRGLRRSRFIMTGGMGSSVWWARSAPIRGYSSPFCVAASLGYFAYSLKQCPTVIIITSFRYVLSTNFQPYTVSQSPKSTNGRPVSSNMSSIGCVRSSSGPTSTSSWCGRLKLMICCSSPYTNSFSTSFSLYSSRILAV